MQRNRGKKKEIGENDTTGKSRDLCEKNRDTKGKLHAKIGSITDRNSMDLTEAENTKRWQEHKEEPYKKILMMQITMMV